MTTVFLGLGSNRGDRKKNILKAIKLLKESGQKVLRLSSMHETKPYGYKKQKKFLNAAVKLKTKLLPLELLELCKKIEKKIGRTKSFRWGPREIDVDILFFGKKVIKSKKFTIPHSDLHNRNFVLIPLVEIAPNFVHPVLKKRVSEMYSTIQGEK
ncbi:MAG: 2-amino-4-hydroxy-6-hydroxymethyldihydropteridine diphosphokinase [Elusimicrobiota bacterium]|nr:2-amino-4-hydroxy-6-hydroxymethyldihydropteridine diphosphokinase [Elusimicrobiota bacterium]